jgi:ankyrin repeat protein
LGTYDIAFKQTESQSGNDAQTFYNEAVEAQNNGDLVLAREKYLAAIDAYKVILSSKQHDRIAREGIIEAWSKVARLYPDYRQSIFPEEIEFNRNLEEKVFGVASLKTAFIDNLLEGDWRKQCNGKYGGPKPYNKSWKQFYFDNEKEVELVESVQEKVYWAVQKGHDAYLSFILGKEKDVKINDTISKDSKETFLEVAVKKGFKDVVATLLDNGAKVTTKGTGKWVPLHWAVFKGNKDIIMTLLDNGAKVNVKDERSITPLHIAAFNGFDEVVDILLDKGARVNAADKSGLYTALHYAVYQDQIDIAAKLLEAGANIKHHDKNLRTLLHWAATMGKPDMVELLISRGANVNAKDDLGRMPLHWAAQCGRHDVISILVDHKAKINEADKFGEKPMLIAAFCNHTKEVSLLFENGAR